MKVFFSFLFLLLSFFAIAQSGTIDKTYGKNGFSVFTTQPSGLDVPSQKVALQKDDKLLYLTDVKDSTTNNYIYVTRLAANGTVDKTFGKNGVTALDFSGDEANGTAIVVQADGKILVTGLYSKGTNGDDYQILLVRLNSNGSLDATFGTAGILNIGNPLSLEIATSIQLVGAGKILVGGIISDEADQLVLPLLMRLNPNGSFDNTFGTNGIYKYDAALSNTPTKYIYNVAIDKIGNIFAAGKSVNKQGENKAFLIKTSENGVLDNTFGTNGIVEIGDDNADDKVFFSNLKVQSDGKIVVLKNISLADDSQIGKLLRFQSNGKEDTAFGVAGIININIGGSLSVSPNDLLLQSDGKIIVNVIGIDNKSTTFNNATARYDKTGKIDNAFGIQGIVTVNSDSIDYLGANLRMASDGKVIVSVEGSNFKINQFQRTTLRLLNPEITTVQDILLVNDLKIFPNPVQNELILNYTLENLQNNISIDLVNLEGKIIVPLLQNISRNAGAQTEYIYLGENIASGVYFLTLKNATFMTQIKVVKI